MITGVRICLLERDCSVSHSLALRDFCSMDRTLMKLTTFVFLFFFPSELAFVFGDVKMFT